MHHQNNIDPRPGKVGQLRNLYETLKERLVNFKNSDDYIQFLKFQAHTLKTNIAKYSFANRLLIYAQKPTATYVAGYKTWKEFNRYVLHGEKAIWIYAPIVKKVPVETDTEQTESQYDYIVVGYKPVPVFDISQTDGEPFQQPDNPYTKLNTATDTGAKLLTTLNLASPVPVKFATLPTNTYGYYNRTEHSITINEKLSVDDQCIALIHELAHFVTIESNLNPELRAQQEVIAESTAFIIAEFFGLDTRTVSTSYLLLYDPKLSNIIAMGEIIQTISTKILDLLSTANPHWLSDVKTEIETISQAPSVVPNC